nr:unnamed protein product [Callosobruchus chinensis]
MHQRSFFSAQGGRSSYLKNRAIRPHLYPRVSRPWTGLPGDVLVEPASVGLFKSRVKKLLLTYLIFP